MDMVANKPIRLLIADDQPICHETLEISLAHKKEVVICGKARNGSELISLIEIVSPELVITDIQMPVMDGIEATKKIRELYPELKILALTQFRDEALIVKMLQAGANGYILKMASTESLLEAIKTIHRGQVYFCESTSHRLLHMIASGDILLRRSLPPGFFAPNEKEILIYICMGYSSKQIAPLLGLALSSVEKYRSRLFRKTGTQNMVGLVMFALRHGIYQLPDNYF